jgi:hypothetical protein
MLIYVLDFFLESVTGSVYYMAIFIFVLSDYWTKSDVKKKPSAVNMFRAMLRMVVSGRSIYSLVCFTFAVRGLWDAIPSYHD